jgi:hypothetical protein
MSEAETIARGLSEAQRGWITNCFYGRYGWRVVGYRKKACELGLCYPNTSRMTPLGLAVRDVIAKGG